MERWGIMHPYVRVAFIPRKRFWHWVNVVFNRVDHSRVRDVGPDRAAAEWALRLGGSVKFHSLDHWSRDYNRLPSEPRGQLLLEAIDVSGIAVTDNGLEHLAGLECLRVLKLSGCKYLYDPGLEHLSNVSASLWELDLSHCYGVTAAGLPSLYPLRCLRMLDLQNTLRVRRRKEAISQLQKALPHCHILN